MRGTAVTPRFILYLRPSLRVADEAAAQSCDLPGGDRAEALLSIKSGGPRHLSSGVGNRGSGRWQPAPAPVAPMASTLHEMAAVKLGASPRALCSSAPGD